MKTTKTKRATTSTSRKFCSSAFQLLFFLSISGCCCQCGPQKESYVKDVPATLKEAKALEKPPKVIVTVERVTKTRTGGAGCGHSAACIILVPFLLYEAAFPEKYDAVSVKEDGNEIFGATYTTGGDLIHGLKDLGGGKKKEVFALELKELGKRVIVESAEIAADGTRTPKPLQKQHDFLGDYAKALAKETKPKDRGELLAEELSWFGEEAASVIAERLKDPKEPDRSKAVVVGALCRARQPDSLAYEKQLLASVSSPPGTFTALELIPCTDDAAEKGRLIEAVVTGVCLEPDSFQFHQLYRDVFYRFAGDPHVLTAAKACTVPERRALFLLKVGEEPQHDELVKLLAGPLLEYGEDVVHLDKPDQRAAYFEALATGLNTSRLLFNLFEHVEKPLKPQELEALATAYGHGGVAERRETARIAVLEAMFKSREDCSTAGAKKILTARRDREKPEDRTQFDVALLVLGDRSRLDAAKRGLGDKEIYETRRISERGLELTGDLPPPPK